MAQHTPFRSSLHTVARAVACGLLLTQTSLAPAARFTANAVEPNAATSVDSTPHVTRLMSAPSASSRALMISWTLIARTRPDAAADGDELAK